MNRSWYYNYIEEKIDLLALRIEKRGKINLLDLHIHAETFFAEFLNILFEYQLENLNKIKPNVEAIDLIDKKNQIIVQVSATCTKRKIEDSLAKDIFTNYKGFCFKFISISKDATSLRQNTFTNPHAVLFSPKDDIIDTKTILNTALHMTIDKQKAIYEFVKKELGSEIDIVKLDSNLATIISILANEDLTENSESPEINPFEIQNKIDFNNLIAVQATIDEYKIYYHKLDEKYTEFNKQGVNKSLSIFRAIKTEYTKLLSIKNSPHDLFFSIVESLIEKIVNSKNHTEIPFEELEMCVYILVVDAFIRCKIFKNPEGYNHVATR